MLIKQNNKCKIEVTGRYRQWKANLGGLLESKEMSEKKQEKEGSL